MAIGIRLLVIPPLLSGLLRSEPILASGCPAPKFVAAGTFAAGNQPVALAVADLSGDGKIDLVVANQFSANVSVLLGRGDGTFLAAVNYPAGASPSAVGIGDFNRDGKPDLVVTDLGSTNLWLLLGNGNGTFQAPVGLNAGDTAQSLAVSDVNGDGKLDLAVVNRGSDNVSVLLGRGDGTFQSPVSYAVGTDPVSVTVGDLNRDNRPDLAVANASLFDDVAASVSILLGNSNGTFRAAVDYVAGASPRSVGMADFNGDGKTDLAVANYGALDANNQYRNSSFSVWLGNGDGTCQVPGN